MPGRACFDRDAKQGGPRAIAVKTGPASTTVKVSRRFGLRQWPFLDICEFCRVSAFLPQPLDGFPASKLRRFVSVLTPTLGEMVRKRRFSPPKLCVFCIDLGILIAWRACSASKVGNPHIPCCRIARRDAVRALMSGKLAHGLRCGFRPICGLAAGGGPGMYRRRFPQQLGATARMVAVGSTG